jgi:hypothetical protein
MKGVVPAAVAAVLLTFLLILVFAIFSSTSASRNSGAEDIRVLPAIVPEIKFVNVEGARRALRELRQSHQEAACAGRSHGRQCKPA